MKKALLILSVFVLISSCKKDSTEPMPENFVVTDQAKIEANMPGSWKGMVQETNGWTEDIEVTITEMKVGEKVGEGRYDTDSFSCKFEWTYESLNEFGFVTFREKTLAPNFCYDNVAVLGTFKNDDFDVVHLIIEIDNLTFTGEMSRK